MAGSRWERATLNDRGVIVAGGVVLVASFLPYVGLEFGPISRTTTAWASYAILGLLLLLAATGLVALRTFTDVALPLVPGSWALYTAIASGLGTLLVLVRALTSGAYAEVLSVEWGGYILFIAAITQTVFAVRAMIGRSAGPDAPAA